MFKNKKIPKILFTTLFLIFLDQITKFYFTNQKYFQIISDFLYLEFHKNSGSAFSLFSNVNYYNYFIIFLSIIFLIYLIIKKSYFLEVKYKINSYILIYIFLISGIVGNLIDRIILGYVRDFIGIKYFSIFNFSDIYLTLVIILFLYSEFNKNTKKKSDV